jgi:hypothetical protein
MTLGPDAITYISNTLSPGIKANAVSNVSGTVPVGAITVGSGQGAKDVKASGITIEGNDLTQLHIHGGTVDMQGGTITDVSNITLQNINSTFDMNGAIITNGTVFGVTVDNANITNSTIDNQSIQDIVNTIMTQKGAQSVGITSAPNYSLVAASGPNAGKIKQLVAGSNIILTEPDNDKVTIFSSPTVKSFSATYLGNYIAPVDNNLWLVEFTKIDYNVGGFVYDPIEHLITLPLTGTYIVTATIDASFASGYMGINVYDSDARSTFPRPTDFAGFGRFTVSSVDQLSTTNLMGMEIYSRLSGSHVRRATLKLEYLHS